MAQDTKKSFILLLGIPDLRFGQPNLAKSELESVGTKYSSLTFADLTVVPGVRSGNGIARCWIDLLSDCHWIWAPRFVTGLQRSLANHHARTRGSKFNSSYCVQSRWKGKVIFDSHRWTFKLGRIDDSEITFYGSSFISNQFGKKIAEADRKEETILTATFDRDELELNRRSWGVFRDRRPSLYKILATHDGNPSHTWAHLYKWRCFIPFVANDLPALFRKDFLMLQHWGTHNSEQFLRCGV